MELSKEQMIKINTELSNEAQPTFASPLLGDGAVIGWWSGGITSAIACRLAIEKHKQICI